MWPFDRFKKNKERSVLGNLADIGTSIDLLKDAQELAEKRISAFALVACFGEGTVPQVKKFNAAKTQCSLSYPKKSLVHAAVMMKGLQSALERAKSEVAELVGKERMEDILNGKKFSIEEMDVSPKREESTKDGNVVKLTPTKKNPTRKYDA